MKYTFNTLEEVKQAIEQWFITLGYDNKERSEKQYLKIISEIGETADSICKENRSNTLSEIGDIFVTIIGYELQRKNNIVLNYYDYDGESLSEPESYLNDLLDSILDDCLSASLTPLNWLAFTQDSNLLECATIAYNKIQGRLERGELSVKNGTVIKSGN